MWVHVVHSPTLAGEIVLSPRLLLTHISSTLGRSFPSPLPMSALVCLVHVVSGLLFSSPPFSCHQQRLPGTYVYHLGTPFPLGLAKNPPPLPLNSAQVESAESVLAGPRPPIRTGVGCSLARRARSKRCSWQSEFILTIEDQSGSSHLLGPRQRAGADETRIPPLQLAQRPRAPRGHPALRPLQ